MELQVSQRDTDILLKQKNVLEANVLDKYRLAGQVSQTCLSYLISLINDSYHLGKHSPYSAAELCLLGDSYLKSALKNVYKNQVKEKGISQPITIDVNDVVVGYSPEIDEEVNIFFKPGDIVTINLGCHVDGYTSNLSHTLVIYPPGVPSEDGQSLKPTGPLLGASADAICAAHIANETVIALLGASLTPEKLPLSLTGNNKVVTGSLIRSIVDSIAESFNCIIVPTSKVRRIRRFLAGQAEGIVAERDFKGVVWSESDQELKLLQKSPKFSDKTELIAYDKSKNASVTSSSAIPSDDFIVSPGEVYMVDIKMAPLASIEGPGLVTLQSVDNFTGKNHSRDAFNPRPSIYIRDVTQTHHLKLKASRKLLTTIDNDLSVYPFKLSHISDSFPIDLSKDVKEQLKLIQTDMKQGRLGLSELTNRHLTFNKPIQRARFLPLKVILNASTSTGFHGYDAENPSLPGLELPLPRLGITALKLKTLLKASKEIPVARELSTVVLNANSNELIRLSGGSKTAKASWVHSEYQLSGPFVEGINELIQSTQDERFGIKIKECQPMDIKIKSDATISGEVEMEM